VTVVVLAVNFLAVVFTGGNIDLLSQGAGIALPIAALGVFLGLRSWGARQDTERHKMRHKEVSALDSTENRQLPDDH
jgi:hypothetical protein